MITNIRGKRLGDLAKFFVLCFCLLFWQLTLQKNLAKYKRWFRVLIQLTHEWQQNNYVIHAWSSIKQKMCNRPAKRCQVKEIVECCPSVAFLTKMVKVLLRLYTPVRLI